MKETLTVIPKTGCYLVSSEQSPMTSERVSKDKFCTCGGTRTSPCQHIEALATSYPNLIGDNRRLQTAGLEQWIDEQKERVRRGVVYADIRYRALGSENDADE